MWEGLGNIVSITASRALLMGETVDVTVAGPSSPRKMQPVLGNSEEDIADQLTWCDIVGL